MDEGKRCGDCKYIGAETGEELVDRCGTVIGFYHFCENSKSMYKVCIKTATRCNQYENDCERVISNAKKGGEK